MKILKLTLFIFLICLVFATCKKDKGMPTVTDVDGNVYHTVKIGTQTWMVENLKTTHYKDNTPVTLITDNNLWKNAIAPGYCWYDNDIANKTPYGALYNWYTVNTGKLAPQGWHVPSAEEWQTLIAYLGGITEAGGKLKEEGTMHWNSPNVGATNESKLSFVGSGLRRDSDGSFLNKGNYSMSRCSTNSSFVRISFDDFKVITGAVPPEMGYSVRCIKD